MDIATLVMAYGAAAFVAVTVTAAFSTPIEEVLFRLLPTEVAPAWQQFVKFALFVVSFGGGMPLMGDRGAPAAPALPGENFMIVMGSLNGALMAAAWVLLVFFALTLAALAAFRVHTLIRRRRQEEANRIADREEQRKREKAAHEPTGSRRL